MANDGSSNMTDQERNIYQVSDLVSDAKKVLEREFRMLWVEGEISNFSQPKSGHWYFTLKDDKAQIKCALFRGQNKRLNFTPEEGLQVLIRCRVSIYEPRGDFQAIADSMEVAGDGALRLAFEQLYKKLQQEGLLDESKKRPIPEFPDHIGVITSPTGAAVHDVLTVLKRRYPIALVSLLPASTQGKQSPAELIQALQLAERYNKLCASDSATIKVLVFGRGGGALEDLQSFNDEAVVRALAACSIPVVTGIGHETDTTIADFAGDLRAATPSAAAEIISQNQADMLADFLHWRGNLTRTMQDHLNSQRQYLQQTARALQSPQSRLQSYQQRLDDLSSVSKNQLTALLTEKKLSLEKLRGNLKATAFMRRLTQLRLQLNHIAPRLQNAAKHRIQIQRQRMQGAVAILNTLNPLDVLGRGYAVLMQASNIVTSTEQVAVGQSITAFLKQGALDCEVKAVKPEAGLGKNAPTQRQFNLNSD